ncbi:hypothetical protein Ami103574_14010 [Aminipila butyrica]|uniref:Adenosylcobinamide kinase n=1 Tax=Aminipila butyrica TaxID=433296 RepID=A0A858BXN3_9FIRM|nr:bifunctional adenosylcobinamide kinase/adenosylcobinamide-phosphate guanylyltransferase [Aminipila butyrica]QIB70337.1 hypothetical protein Ami103574_14010 [Aminipila butyrica]
MNVFISGGCKNGKSMYAQTIAREMAKEQDKVSYYLATMRPTDEEDLKRIDRHISEREGWGFTTLEQSENILCCLKPVSEGQLLEKPCQSGAEEKANPAGVFLLDSVTALLSNEMFKADGSMDLDAGIRVAEELREFARRTGNTVFVSDYIYGEAAAYDPLTETYRKSLALIDRTLAEACQRVMEVSFGNVVEYKTF